MTFGSFQSITFIRKFAKHGDVQRFSIQRNSDGWFAQEENNGSIVRQLSSRNWIRIENQMAIFNLAAEALASAGWQELTS